MKLSFNNHIAIIILLSCALLLCVGCREAVKTFSDLSALRDELTREYKEPEIEVVIQNSNILGITFNNSSFNNLSEQERAAKAREIAFFAKTHYVSISSVDTIWVSFAITKNYIVFYYRNGLDTYFFEKPSLTPAGPPRNVGPQGNAIASYNPISNRTDVYLSKNLQLYSDTRSNVMLLPHFVIPGDNARTPKIVVPESVALDFTAYSDKRMFPDEPRLIIYVDGKKVFSGRARVTNVMGSNEEKSVNEFLSREISYSEFWQLTNGKRVKISLGPKEFELTGEQIEALQSMRKCVEESRCT